MSLQILDLIIRDTVCHKFYTSSMHLWIASSALEFH